MALYAGMDLHSSNTYLGIMDDKFKRVFNKRLRNDLSLIIANLEPFREELKGIPARPRTPHLTPKTDPAAL